MKRKIFSTILLLSIIGVAGCNSTESSSVIETSPVESTSESNQNKNITITKPNQSVVIEDSGKYLNDYGSYFEGMYFEWQDTSSNATVKYAKKGTTKYTEIDDELIRYSNGVCRADIVGLSAGEYDVIISRAAGEEITLTNMEAIQDDRSGYAFFKATTFVGAYNNDGTLNKNADILYVTDETKNTVTYEIMGQTYTGLCAILQAYNPKPLTIRIIGMINAATWNPLNTGGVNVVGANGQALKQESMTEEEIIAAGYNSMSNDISNGITKLNGLNNNIKYSNGEYDSSYNMLSVNGAQNVTLEGIGFDAGLYQWGITWKNCNYIEVKNLTFDDYPEDACAAEGPDDSTTIDGFTTGHIWIHNNTFNEGKNNWDVTREQDKHEGDGATDFKKNAYITVSYNHYYKNHKTGLVGGGDSQHTACITYHHNFYDQCSSRLPLGRQANMHMYNNYYYKSSGTNMSIRAGGYAFIENCYFEGVTNPIEVKEGAGLKAAVKSYNNIFNNCSKTNNATIVSSRDQYVDSDNIYGKDFDVNSSIFYYDSVNKCSDVQRMTSAAQAKEDCKALAGVFFKGFADIKKADESSEVITPTESSTIESAKVESTIISTPEGEYTAYSFPVGSINACGVYGIFDISFATDKIEFSDSTIKFGGNKRDDEIRNDISFTADGMVVVEITCKINSTEKTANIAVAQGDLVEYKEVSTSSKVYTFTFEDADSNDYAIYRYNGGTGIYISNIVVKVYNK